MQIHDLSALVEAGGLGASTAAAVRDTASGSSVSFAELLGRLSSYQARTDEAVDRLIMGEEVDLHEVMLSAEQTDIAFRVAIQLRNKLVRAYEEIMHMQV